MSTQLDSFEERLLAELRDYATEPAAAGRRHEQRSQRPGAFRYVLRGIAVAAAIGAIFMVPGLSSTPAYSVGEGNPGEVHVQINRPEDAAGLERALQEHGINADITYLPALQTCAPGRYKEVDRETNMMASISEQHISVTLAPDTVRDGETFVLTWSVEPLTDEELDQIGARDGASAVDGFSTKVDFAVATGAVAPCQPIADK